jgi:hypothetical protein
MECLQKWLKENFWYETEEENIARCASENGKKEETVVSTPVRRKRSAKAEKSPFPVSAANESGKGELGG